MSFEELNEFQDQAERPDLRFWTGLSLMIIGLGLSYFTVSPSEPVGEIKVVQAQTLESNDIKTNVKQDPEFIKQLNADDVTELFGAPDFLRGEGKFLMWQYKSDQCILEIYWEDKNDKGLIPRHILLRDVLKTESNCIESLF